MESGGTIVEENILKKQVIYRYDETTAFPGWKRIEMKERNSKDEKFKRTDSYYIDPSGKKHKRRPKANKGKKTSI